MEENDLEIDLFFYLGNFYIDSSLQLGVSIGPSIRMKNGFWSTNFTKVLLCDDPVIALAGLFAPLFQRIYSISLRSFDCLKDITSIMCSFSFSDPSLVRHR